jgi:adenine specific DNA methylase Mod
VQNKLWFGDNLTILREEIPDSSVDLIYLDPPFNSQANYNVLFKTPDDDAASAQVEAFRDTWTWGPEAQWAYDEVMRTGGGITSIIYALHSALGQSDMMAYLVMMAQRLHELRRVLKPTGSLYLHCDPTASHYLKIVLDAIFEPANYLNEISWHRTTAKSDYQQGARHFPRVRDVILRYTKNYRAAYVYNQPFRPYDDRYIATKYSSTDADGRRYMLDNITGPGGAAKGNAQYEIFGVTRYWRYSKERMNRLIDEGRVIQPRFGAVPRYKRYLDEMPGVAIGDDWDDIRPLNSQAQERLGYPTQKPLKLLDRIILAATNPGHVVLDPFCGCGTTVSSAQSNGRNWIGIDIAYHAIRVIEDRLADLPGKVEYDLGGIPRDFASAVRLAERDKYQFQWWANYLVGVQALKEVRKGPDRGIDGQMFFMNGPRGWGRVLTSVKGGQHVGTKDVREFKAVISRENAEMGLFICLREPTKDMKSEAASFGFVDTAHGHLPKLQIVSIERWFNGERPAIPSLGHVSRDYFRTSSKPASLGKIKRADPTAPEFSFIFPGGKDDSAVVHFNPSAILKKPVRSGKLI